jgi:hypothetical protein
MFFPPILAHDQFEKLLTVTVKKLIYQVCFEGSAFSILGRFILSN